MGLDDYFRTVRDYVGVDDDAVERAGTAGLRHARYHRRIVWAGAIAGGIGLILGLGLAIQFAALPHGELDRRALLLTPFLFGAGGALTGVAAACLVAPREFLEGPVGQKWMGLIGTRSVSVARLSCAIFWLLIVVPAVVVGIDIVFG